MIYDCTVLEHVGKDHGLRGEKVGCNVRLMMRMDLRVRTSIGTLSRVSCVHDGERLGGWQIACDVSKRIREIVESGVIN